MANTTTVKAEINAPVEKVWEYYTKPDHIVNWNNASDDWHTPEAENDLRVGGRFLSRMEAKDGSAGFDFSGVYDEVIENEQIIYTMDDGRKATIKMEGSDGDTYLEVIFELENINPAEVQQEGWQARY